MNGTPDQTTLREVQEAFSLPSVSLVEKDWHVVRALAAISDIATRDGLTLAFGGGTSLGRAHKILERMSEDIDLRILTDKKPSRTALQKLRKEISNRLEAVGFDASRREVKRNDEYVRFDLPYEPISPREGILRSEIKIDLSASLVRRSIVELPVQSFVSEALQQAPEIARIACVSIEETAAEKFVALTRRRGAFYAGGRHDKTLVRHLYDLTRAEGRYDIGGFTALAQDTMQLDAADRGHDAYKADPAGETRKTVERMTVDEDLKRDYEELMASMVYGARPPFEDAIAVLQALATRV